MQKKKLCVTFKLIFVSPCQNNFHYLKCTWLVIECIHFYLHIAIRVRNNNKHTSLCKLFSAIFLSSECGRTLSKRLHMHLLKLPVSTQIKYLHINFKRQLIIYSLCIMQINIFLKLSRKTWWNSQSQHTIWYRLSFTFI